MNNTIKDDTGEPSMIRFSETEIRNSAKETLEAFEHWSRRIINDKFANKYGGRLF